MNKLQELTDRLYEEGLSKGKAEGEHILEEARKQAEEEEAARKAAEEKDSFGESQKIRW